MVQYRRAGLSADHKDVLDATASLARLLGDWAWAERDSKSEIRNPLAAPERSAGGKSEIAERAREAERLLREVLAIRVRQSTNSWRIGDLKSRLGGALVSVAVTDSAIDAERRRAKLNVAESLLLEGHERLQNSSAEEKYKRDALQRLVRLYEALNKSDKRSEWQQKLELFDKAQKKSSASESDAAEAETR